VLAVCAVLAVATGATAGAGAAATGAAGACAGIWPPAGSQGSPVNPVLLGPQIAPLRTTTTQTKTIAPRLCAAPNPRADAAGDIEFNQESAWAENLVQVLYAAEDEETIKLASKMMGVTPTRITDNKSRESKGTGTQSAVAKIKKNRWGV
jgi:hypothetical protein